MKKKTKLKRIFKMYSEFKLKNSHENTPAKYRTSLKRLNEFLGREARLSDLTDDNLAMFRDGMASDGLARTTTNGYMSNVMTLWRFAFNRGLISTAPTADRLKVTKARPIAFTEEQVCDLLNATSIMKGKLICGCLGDLWFKSLILCLYDTGLRVGAALSLRFENVDFEKRTIYVEAEDQKSGKLLVREIHVDTLTLINEFKTDREFVWPWERTRSSFYRTAKKIFIEAGLPDTRKFKFHAIRKTHGSIVARKLGVSAGAEALQHSELGTFTDHYFEPGNDDAGKFLNALPRPDREGNEK